MFERFTDQSRRAVVLAQDESRRLNHHYIGLPPLRPRQPPASATVLGLLDSIEERLTAIERQLGICGPENVRPPS